MKTKRYKELFKMIKVGKAILPNGEVSQKLSDLKAVDLEFRLSGPSCGKVPSCGKCKHKTICWE